MKRKQTSSTQYLPRSAVLFMLITTLLISTKVQSNSVDQQLRSRLIHYGIQPVVPPAPQDPALVELGRNLFFEKEISGRRNISCATCHNPVTGSADGQSQSRGQGAIGLGPSRRTDANGFPTPVDSLRANPNGSPIPSDDLSFQFLPRNTLSLWNRGTPEWANMFWDGRLEGNANDGFTSPAGDDTPQNFTNVLAAFSIFPITPDEEMRGFPGQPDVLGNANEMADLTNSDFLEIWPLVTARVTNNDGYNDLLAEAFPHLDESDLDITHISEAIGAFMSQAFTALDSPFDRYLAGDVGALSSSAKRGALLFYGPANCAACHSGGLQTDFDFHNIGAPQVGTGRAETAEKGLDLGRGGITGNISDNFKFRTPSLRNVELESPYFHNGAYDDLEDAVRHHFNPVGSLAAYDASQIEPELAGLFQDNPFVIQVLLKNLAPELRTYQALPRGEQDIEDIMAFLSALTDPSSLNLRDIIPDSLPSGLPLAD